MKNQLTLPKAIADLFPGVQYFEVRAEGERIVLEPLRRSRAPEVRKKLAALKLTDADIVAALRFARKRAR